MGAAISAILITSGMEPTLPILLAGVGGMMFAPGNRLDSYKIKNSALLLVF